MGSSRSSRALVPRRQEHGKVKGQYIFVAINLFVINLASFDFFDVRTKNCSYSTFAEQRFSPQLTCCLETSLGKDHASNTKIT